MRFDQLILRRYGHFTDFSLDFSNAKSEVKSGSESTTPKIDFHILFGSNEAGKSTTLAAITDLLFGIDRKTDWNFLHGNDLLELEATLSQNNQSVNLRRFKRYLANSKGDRVDSFPLDLQGLSKEDYRLRFSFDEKTLRDGGEQILNSQGDVGQALFSASSGISDLALRMEKIMEPANSFWAPGKRSKIRLIELKKRLQENKTELSKLRLDVKTWQSRSETLDKNASLLSAAREKKNELQRTIRHLENKSALHKLALKWKSLSERAAALENNGVITLSNGGSLELSSEHAIHSEIARLRQLVEKDQLNSAKLADLQNTIAHNLKQQSVSSLNDIDINCLEEKEAIKQLADTASAAAEWNEQLSSANDEIRRCQHLTADLYSQLGLKEESNAMIPDNNQLENIERLLIDEVTIADRLNNASSEFDELTNQELETLPSDNKRVADDVLDIISDVLKRINQDNFLGKQTTAAESELSSRQELSERALQLGITIDAVEGLKIPDEHTFSKQLDELAELRQLCSQFQGQIAELKSSIQSTHNQIAVLSDNGVTDLTQLKAIKSASEKAWKDHYSNILDEAIHSDLRNSADLFQEKHREHLHIIEKGLSDGQLGAEMKVLQTQQQFESNKLANIEGDLVQASNKRDELTKTILESIASFYFDSSLDTIALREKFSQAVKTKNVFIDWKTQSSNLENCVTQCEQQATKLLKLLEPIESESSIRQLEKLELADLLTRAEKSLERERKLASELLERENDLKRHQAQLDKLRTKRAECQERYDHWVMEWNAAATDNIFASLNPGAAKKALKVVKQIHETNRLSNAAKLTSEETARKVNKRQLALDALLGKLGVASFSIATQQLSDTLEKQRMYQLLKTQHTELKETESNLVQHGANDSLLLSNLCKTYQTNNANELIGLLEETAQLRAVQFQINELHEQIKEIAGEALLETEVSSLLEEFDANQTNNEIEQLKETALHAESEYDDRYREWVLAEKNLNDISDDGQYAKLNQERADILLEIEEGAQATAIARTGEKVFKAAISKFRSENQSVLLNEAQTAFNTLTAGRYTNLIPRDDGRGNERLYAIDEENNARAVEHLSTGTRYQLYLALRAAAHADYSRLRTPLPFVADDIMESFDDERSAAAFKVLGNMATQGQVLYLTHHQHLIEIAQRELGEHAVSVHHY